MPSCDLLQFLEQERVEDRGSPRGLHFLTGRVGEQVPAHVEHRARARLDLEVQHDRGPGLVDVAARAHDRLLEPPLPEHPLDPGAAVLPAKKVKTIALLQEDQLQQVRCGQTGGAGDLHRGHPRFDTRGGRPPRRAEPSERQGMPELEGAVGLVVHHKTQFEVASGQVVDDPRDQAGFTKILRGDEFHLPAQVLADRQPRAGVGVACDETRVEPDVPLAPLDPDGVQTDGAAGDAKHPA